MNRRQRARKKAKAKAHRDNATGHVKRLRQLAERRETLMRESKDELSKLAKLHGMEVKSKTTKQQMVDHIVAVAA